MRAFGRSPGITALAGGVVLAAGCGSAPAPRAPAPPTPSASAARSSAAPSVPEPVRPSAVRGAPWPVLRIGVLYAEGASTGGSAYVAVVRTARRLPNDRTGGFWLGGPRQAASGHDPRPTRPGLPGVCYVAYFYGDEQSVRPDPVIFPPPASELAFGYRTRGRLYGGDLVRLVRARDGIAGRTQASLARRVGCR